MACPICDQKPMNCDCTPRERAMYRELQELEDRPAVVLTDAEREAVEATIVDLDGGANFNEQRFWPMLAKRLRERSATLRGLLDRIDATGSE